MRGNWARSFNRPYPFNKTVPQAWLGRRHSPPEHPDKARGAEYPDSAAGRTDARRRDFKNRREGPRPPENEVAVRWRLSADPDWRGETPGWREVEDRRQGTSSAPRCGKPRRNAPTKWLGGRKPGATSKDPSRSAVVRRGSIKAARPGSPEKPGPRLEEAVPVTELGGQRKVVLKATDIPGRRRGLPAAPEGRGETPNW